MSGGCEVVRTRGGQLAMRDCASGELMHPWGPLDEAERLYVAASQLERRLRAQPAGDCLVLFDVGLGAGSNAAAALQLSERLGARERRLEIVSFERSFDALLLALQPEHRAVFGLDAATAQAAHALLGCGEHRSARTRWRLQRGDVLANLGLQAAHSADVVFWDPFSPRADASLWSVTAFRALHRTCRQGATVHTYSGATAVRSALLLAGFAVGLGEPLSRGKFGTCAALAADDLARPLDRRWLERLARSSAPFATDAPADALAMVRASPQFAA